MCKQSVITDGWRDASEISLRETWLIFTEARSVQVTKYWHRRRPILGEEVYSPCQES